MMELLDCWAERDRLVCKYGEIHSAPGPLMGRSTRRAWRAEGCPHITNAFPPVMLAFDDAAEMWSFESLPKIAITGRAESGDSYDYVRFSGYYVGEDHSQPGRAVTYRMYPARWVDQPDRGPFLVERGPFLVGRLAD